MWKERTRLGMVVDLIVVKHVRRLKGQVLIGTQRGAAHDHMGLGAQEQCSDKQHCPCVSLPRTGQISMLTFFGASLVRAETRVEAA